MNKKIYATLTLGVIGISPLVVSIVTSCSRNKSNEQTSQDAMKIQGFIQGKSVKLTINQASIKITDFDTKNLIKIGFKLDDSKISDETYKKEIQEVINRSEIEFVDYFLPKLNDDANTPIKVKINKSLELDIQLKDFVTQDNKVINVTNLNAQEIKDLLKTKLNSDLNFITSINTFSIEKLRSLYIDWRKNPNNIGSFKTYWNGFGVFGLQQSLKDEMIRKYKNYFYDNASQGTNLYIDVKNISISDTVDSNNKWVVNTRIIMSTYTTTDANDKYEFDLELHIEDYVPTEIN